MRTGRKELTLGLLASGLIALGMFACSDSSSDPPVRKGKGGQTTAETSDDDSEQGGTKNRGGSDTVQNSDDDDEKGGSKGKGGTKDGDDDDDEKGGSSKGGSSSKGGASGKGGSSSKGGDTSGSGGTSEDTSSGSGGTSSTSSAAKAGDPYSGSVKAESKICNNGFCEMNGGKWTGYAFAYQYGTATVSPPCGDSAHVCFESEAKKVCANGSVPADDKSGAGIGINLAQTSGTSTTSTAAVSGAVKIQLKGATAGMRVALVGTDEYCYTLTASDVSTANSGLLSIKASSFASSCWDTSGKAYAGENVKALQVAVPGSSSGSKISYDFCVIDVGQ